MRGEGGKDGRAFSSTTTEARAGEGGKVDSLRVLVGDRRPLLLSFTLPPLPAPFPPVTSLLGLLPSRVGLLPLAFPFRLLLSPAPLVLFLGCEGVLLPAEAVGDDRRCPPRRIITTYTEKMKRRAPPTATPMRPPTPSAFSTLLLEAVTVRSAPPPGAAESDEEREGKGDAVASGTGDSEMELMVEEDGVGRMMGEGEGLLPSDRVADGELLTDAVKLAVRVTVGVTEGVGVHDGLGDTDDPTLRDAVAVVEGAEVTLILTLTLALALALPLALPLALAEVVSVTVGLRLVVGDEETVRRGDGVGLCVGSTAAFTM